MSTEQTSPSDRAALERRAAVHAALADPTRLRIVDVLSVGDAASSELAAALGLPTNLVAHHTKALESAGLISRHRSEGDARRTYWRLLPDAFDNLAPSALRRPSRVLFVCTANTARSQLAAALWSATSQIPAASAGTRPGERIDPGAIAAAERHELEMRAGRPRHIDDVALGGDLVVTVCDLAHEELSDIDRLHWSVPDPVRKGSDDAFDAAYEEIAARISSLVPRLAG